MKTEKDHSYKIYLDEQEMPKKMVQRACGYEK